ncbi:MAG: DUF58 domain-containing protein [Myxococcales bacterium]|nr:DUF58 domain-containing protein [Myxococcales bacterium]
MISKDLVKKLRKIEIYTSRLANEQLVGSYQSVFKGRGMAFSEVRRYQPGDDVRFIDWNVSARMNDVYVKLFTEEREMTVMLLVDLSASGQFGSVGASKLDVAAELSALLAFSAIRNNDRVGLILFTDHIERFVPPKKGRAHVMRVVTEILNAAPRSKGTDLICALELLGHVTRRRSVTFLLSDFIATGYERALQIAARRHDVIPIEISDPRETELPDVGIALFEDLESGQLAEVDTSNPRVRQAYQSTLGARSAERHKLFRRHRLDYVSVATDRSYVTPIVELFQRRQRRARSAL